MTEYVVEGIDRLNGILSKLGDASYHLDSVFSKNARQVTRSMILKTPKKTGTTARGWSTPQKIGLSHYVVSNESKVTGVSREHSLIDILDRGRGEVVPVIAKRLYIPLTQAGMSKKKGSPIPKTLVYGKDYIFAKKSKAVKGKAFVKPTVDEQGKILVSDIINRIRDISNGQ